MKLNSSPQLAQGPDSEYDKRLAQSLIKWMRDVVTKLNQVAGGTAAGFDGAATAAPTTDTWAQGDKVRNSAPAVLGTAGSRYVIDGWICVAGGTPGTWAEQRTLTGT